MPNHRKPRPWMSKNIGQNQENINSPRWIVDLENMELSERQPDGSYRPAYDMRPIIIDPQTLPWKLRQMAIDAAALGKLDAKRLDNLLHEAADIIEKDIVAKIVVVR